MSEQMQTPENSPNNETAIDLTDAERQEVRDSLLGFMENHGTLCYFGDQAKPGLAAYKAYEMPAGSVAATGLGYDSVSVEAYVDERGHVTPDSTLGIGTKRAVTRNDIPTGPDTPPVFGFGTEERIVILDVDKELGLGITVEEDGEAEYVTGIEPDEYLALSESGELVNVTALSPTYVDSTPPLSRQDILTIARAVPNLP